MEEKTPELSEREQEILRLIATGASNKEIAHKLVISPNTVKVHVRNIFGKIGAASRTEAAMYAVNNGIIKSDNPISASLDNTIVGIRDTSPIMDDAFSSMRQQRPNFQHYVVIIVVIMLILTGISIIFPWLRSNLSQSPSLSSTPQLSQNWKVLPKLPAARRSFALSVISEQIYVIGGEGEDGITSTVFVFDTIKEQWKENTSKPTPVSDVTGVTINGEIYVPGGRISANELTDQLEVYNPSSDSWEKRSSLPKPISGYAAVALEGNIYIFGGWDGEQVLDIVWIYDAATDSWTESMPMPTSRQHAAAVIINGEILVVGGENKTGALAVSEVFMPNRDNIGDSLWRKAPSMPEGRYAFGAASIANILFIIGGKGNSGNIDSGLVSYNQGDLWILSDVASQIQISNFGLAPVGLYIYLIGGEANGQISDQVYFYQALYTVSIPVILGEDN